MSLVEIEQDLDLTDKDEEEGDSEKVLQCCSKHYLVNSKIAINDQHNNLTYINFNDLNSSVHLNQLQLLVTEKNHLIANLEKENVFLREQVRSLNLLLDQLSASARAMSATRNDIRISVENSTSMTMKKWYRRPKVVLSGSAAALLFAIYLRYKIKHW